MNLIASILLSVFVMFGVGCEKYTSKTKVQYMPDMADAPTVKAQEDYLDPPEGAVAREALVYPETLEVAEGELRNPYPNSEAILADGKELYDTFCTVCHGADGQGQGTLGTSYPTPPPSLIRDDLAARKDGFYFMKISKGGALMPAYGYAISARERWKIIKHLRVLQKDVLE